VLTSGDASVTSWQRESVDNVQLDAVRTGARSSTSISSWSFEEGWPEGLPGDGEMQVRTHSSIHCEIGAKTSINRCARSWER
jgi:hypothetical protein